MPRPRYYLSELHGCHRQWNNERILSFIHNRRYICLVGLEILNSYFFAERLRGQIFAEIDFLVVSDRGDRYLSDAFGPMKNIVPSRKYSHLKVSATV